MGAIYKNGIRYGGGSGGGGSGESIQKVTLPTPDATQLGAIYQYIGHTTAQYESGFFYECIQDGVTYRWKQKDTQPGDICVSALPTPTGVISGKIALLTAPQTGYTVGTIYQCVYEDSTYIWRAINTSGTDGISNQFIDELFE